MRRLTVAKFGGSSVRDARAMERCLSILERDAHSQVVVVSALKGVTNDLEKCAELAALGHLKSALHQFKQVSERHFQILSSCRSDLECLFDEATGLLEQMAVKGELCPKLMDQFYSIGERASSFIFSILAKRRLGRNIVLLDARKLIRTDDQFGRANPSIDEVTRRCHQNILPLIAEGGCTIVTQGFIASNAQGETTTLGREGSDYSAALLAAGCGADLLKIWTDVPGIASADPRLVSKANFMSDMSYAEAALLAEKGANVLHPKTLWPVINKSIPVMVGSTFEPQAQGTFIRNKAQSRKAVQALTLRDDFAYVSITSNGSLQPSDFFSSAFQVLTEYDFQLEWNTCSSNEIRLVLSERSLLDGLIDRLNQFANVSVQNRQSIMTLVGQSVHKNSNLMAKVYKHLIGACSEIHTTGEGEQYISFLVPELRAKSLVRQLHAELLEDQPTLNLRPADVAMSMGVAQ